MEIFGRPVWLGHETGHNAEETGHNVGDLGFTGGGFCGILIERQPLGT